MCGSLEKRGDGDRETERERQRERDRDRPGFKGPSVSFGAVGPKRDRLDLGEFYLAKKVYSCHAR